jgi:hypothetical protein
LARNRIVGTAIRGDAVRAALERQGPEHRGGPAGWLVGRAVEVPGLGALNKGGQAGVASVSCGSAGSCAAGEDYQNHGLQGSVAIERHGR